MAQLRLIGERDEVEALLEVLGDVVHVADVSYGSSRRNPAHVLAYAHAAPVVTGEVVVTTDSTDPQTTDRRRLERPAQGALAPGRRPSRPS